MTLPIEAAIRFYRSFLSPLKVTPSCRFYPSCSSYALTAVRRFGPVIGVWLMLRRLVRCHPWNAGGVDHVPPRGANGRPNWEAARAELARKEAVWAHTARGDDPDTPAHHEPSGLASTRQSPIGGAEHHSMGIMTDRVDSVVTGTTDAMIGRHNAPRRGMH
nr:membrane protein insertion efficiency factor YidD [Austwickia sp. TVS 96-490-7B]